jgi:hypothetical protein
MPKKSPQKWLSIGGLESLLPSFWEAGYKEFAMEGKAILTKKNFSGKL